MSFPACLSSVTELALTSLYIRMGKKRKTMAIDVHITGRSKHVQQLRKHVASLACVRNDVLVVGEAGVGKTSIARLIAGGDALVTVDLAGETESSLKSVLAAVVRGTAVLERLEDAGYRIQDQVLDFLGSRPPEVRLIVTLSQRPEDLLKHQRVNNEFCMKVTGFETVTVAPLRDRPEDIPLLVKQFANGLVIDMNSLETLVKLPWRENIRQLRSFVEHCIESAEDGRFVLPASLIDERTEVAKIVGDLMESQKPVLDLSLDIIENSIIRRTLERFGFNESKSAEFLGMTEHSFSQKVRRLALARTR